MKNMPTLYTADLGTSAPQIVYFSLHPFDYNKTREHRVFYWGSYTQTYFKCTDRRDRDYCVAFESFEEALNWLLDGEDAKEK